MNSEPRSPREVRRILLDGLSDEAAAIVQSPFGQLLVVAGAGAGKTEAMARRIAWWHAIDGVPKDRIVAFTFTERAAEEMKFRVRRFMAKVSPEGEDPSLGGMYVGTIHGYCMNTLYCERFGCQGTDMPDLKIKEKLYFNDLVNINKGRRYFTTDDHAVGSEMVMYLDKLYPKKSKWE